jgi:predicted metalloprotease with PDZ domain
MYRHLIPALALLGLSLGAAPLAAQSQPRTEGDQSQPQRRAYLGAEVEASPPDQQQQGVAVEAVSPNGPAARAGLRSGDVITQVGSRTVEDYSDLSRALGHYEPGDRVRVHVQRNGQERTFTVSLGDRRVARMPQADEDSRSGQGQYGRDEGTAGQGRVLQRLGERIRQLEERFQEADRSGQSGRERQGAYLGVQTRQATRDEGGNQYGNAEEGVLVGDVESDSPAAEAGIRRGDVITSVDGERVSSPQDLRQAVRQAGAGHRVTIRVLRNGQPLELRTRLERASSGGDQGRDLQQLERRVEELEGRIREEARQGQSDRGDNPTDQAREYRRLENRLQRLEERIQERQRENSRRDDNQRENDR